MLGSIDGNEFLSRRLRRRRRSASPATRSRRCTSAAVSSASCSPASSSPARCSSTTPQAAGTTRRSAGRRRIPAHLRTARFDPVVLASPARPPTSSALPATGLSIGGATVGRVVLNALGYLEVTFRPPSGNTLEHTTINGDELQLTDAAGTTVALGSTLIRVGLSTPTATA